MRSEVVALSLTKQSVSWARDSLRPHAIAALTTQHQNLKPTKHLNPIALPFYFSCPWLVETKNPT
ncbi:MAG: hypothetical protein ABJI60_11490, partial [Kangiellaceae bacterium]